MKLSIAKDDGQRVRVSITGPITQHDSGALSEPLQELLGPTAYGRHVSLDLRESSHVDSSGVGWLLTCHKRMRQAGGRLTLHAPHPIVANVFKVLRLEKVLEIEEASGGTA